MTTYSIVIHYVLCSQPSPVEKYSILNTAVYRARTETKHKAEINEEGGVCSSEVYVNSNFFLYDKFLLSAS